MNQHPRTGTPLCDLRGAGFAAAEAARIHAIQPAVQMASLTWGIPPWVINGTIWVESRFQPFAVSAAGAKGLMQVMDRTGEEVARVNGLAPWRPFDPENNVMVGAAFMSMLRQGAEQMLVHHAVPTTEVVAQWGYLPGVWEVVAGGYFAGMAGVKSMVPGSTVHGHVMRYVRAVTDATEKFRAAATYCDTRPDWHDAPAPQWRGKPSTDTRNAAVGPGRSPAPPTKAAPAGGGAGVLVLALVALGGARW